MLFRQVRCETSLFFYAFSAFFGVKRAFLGVKEGKKRLFSLKNRVKMYKNTKNAKNRKKMHKNLQVSKICCNFAPDFKKETKRNQKLTN